MYTCWIRHSNFGPIGKKEAILFFIMVRQLRAKVSNVLIDKPFLLLQLQQDTRWTLQTQMTRQWHCLAVFTALLFLLALVQGCMAAGGDEHSDSAYISFLITK